MYRGLTSFFGEHGGLLGQVNAAVRPYAVRTECALLGVKLPFFSMAATALAGQKSTDFGVLEATSIGGRKSRKKPIGTRVSNGS